jgi:hypothetical protein
MVDKVNHNKNYYTEKDRLFKPLNVLKRNQQRLANTSLQDMIIEIIKNAIEHGNGLLQIYHSTNGEVSFFNTISKKKENSITFHRIIEKLTTFQETTDTNFHEGLTTLLLCQSLIRTKHYFVANRASGDGFFQYIDNASHYIDEKGEEILLSKQKILSGWEVTLFNMDSSIHEQIIECLTHFRFNQNFFIKIELNGKPFKTARMKKQDAMKIARYKGTIYYDLDYDKQSEGQVDIYWRLNNQRVFQKLNNSQFNNRRISGKMILTSIYQFANENRNEFAQPIITFFEEKFQNILKEKQGDLAFLEELKNFDIYKQSYSNTLVEVLDIPISQANKLFNGLTKEKALIFCTNFIFTLGEILNIHEKYKFNPPKLFYNVSSPPKIMSDAQFIKALKKLKYNLKKLRSRFNYIPLGIKILNGDPEGFLFFGNIDEFNFGQSRIQVIDPQIGFQQLYFFDNDIPLVYPTNPHFNLLIQDIPHKYIKSNKDFRSYPPISISKLKQLEKFGVSKGNPLAKNKISNPLSPQAQNKLEVVSASKPSNLAIQGIKYDLSIFSFGKTPNIKKIPIIFKSKDRSDLSKLLENTKEFQHKLFSFYRIIKLSANILIRNYDKFPEKRIYPVLFYQPKGPFALYLNQHGILCYNILKFPDYGNSTSDVCAILDTVAHELAHEFAMNHGRIHETHFEKLLRVAKGQDKQLKKNIIQYLKSQLKTY